MGVKFFLFTTSSQGRGTSSIQWWENKQTNNKCKLKTTEVQCSTPPPPPHTHPPARQKTNKKNNFFWLQNSHGPKEILRQLRNKQTYTHQLRVLVAVSPALLEGLSTDAAVCDAATQTHFSPAAALHSSCCTHRLCTAATLRNCQLTFACNNPSWPP